MLASIRDEAILISKYLIGVVPTDAEISRYEQAMMKNEFKLSAKEQSVWKKMIRSSFWMGLYDGGLALTDPHNNCRRRIFVMLAILEASPNHHQHFLPQNYPKWKLITLMFAGVQGSLRGVFGAITVKLGL